MRDNPEPEENIIIYIIPCPDCNGDGCVKCNFKGKIEVREGNPTICDADVINPMTLKKSLKKIDSGYKFKINIDNLKKAGFKEEKSEEDVLQEWQKRIMKKIGFKEEFRTPPGFVGSIKNKTSKEVPSFDEVINKLIKMGYLNEFSDQYECPKCGKEIDITNLCLKPGDQVMCDNCKVFLAVY